MNGDLSRYEREIGEQADALWSFARAPMPAGLSDLRTERFDRIILTGMGASHHAALPNWIRLAADGRPAYWLSTARLLDAPELVTQRSLLIVTSQSGRSGEVVELCEWLGRFRRSARLLAVTNDTASPLARAASATVDLCAGKEEAVSSKTFLNSLAAHDRLGAVLSRHGGAWETDNVETVAEHLSVFDCSKAVSDLVSTTLASGTATSGHLVGCGADLASALWGGLVLKEATGVPVEGHHLREFRHGPQEAIGPGVFVVAFVPDSAGERACWQRLSRTAVRSGAALLCAGDDGPADGAAVQLRIPGEPQLLRLALQARVIEQLAIGLAHARGLEPGLIRLGDKVTTGS